ncbi:hypothetical protein Pla52o_13760 [Novipirellula galeiformis]|uniref:Uncharacterized protein n=1 Tax=Novipirellula galeiformis TaxID=2528004 RepID=A0A5C6CQI8_9BACT|nr:hypothetical protein [Novipirellula galeiformis]TWU25079.1 hypothetical protein Pla52o_13760 [Novipirellula galeiformis]
MQIKDSDAVANGIKAWGWTIRTLRERGALITAPGLADAIKVPDDVRVGGVYAGADSDQATEDAFQVFKDKDIDAECVPIDSIQEYDEPASAFARDETRIED